MRSIVRNAVDEFLGILRYDKTEWKDFWKRLKKRFSPLLDGYEECVERACEKLERIRRMDLDRFRRFWEERGKEIKSSLAYEIRRRAGELKLSREDFVVFLISGVGSEGICVVDGKKEKVILVDVFAFWMEGNVDHIPEAVLKTVKGMREEG